MTREQQIENLIEAAKRITREWNNPDIGGFRGSLVDLDNAISSIEQSDFLTINDDGQLIPGSRCPETPLHIVNEQSDLITIGGGDKAPPGTRGLWYANDVGCVCQLAESYKAGDKDLVEILNRLYITREKAVERMKADGYVEIADGFVKREQKGYYYVQPGLDKPMVAELQQGVVYPNHCFISLEKAKKFLADEMKKQGKVLTADGVWVDGNLTGFAYINEGELRISNNQIKKFISNKEFQCYSSPQAAATAWLKLMGVTKEDAKQTIEPTPTNTITLVEITEEEAKSNKCYVIFDGNICYATYNGLIDEWIIGGALWGTSKPTKFYRLANPGEIQQQPTWAIDRKKVVEIIKDDLIYEKRAGVIADQVLNAIRSQIAGREKAGEKEDDSDNLVSVGGLAHKMGEKLKEDEGKWVAYDTVGLPWLGVGSWKQDFQDAHIFTDKKEAEKCIIGLVSTVRVIPLSTAREIEAKRKACGK